MKTTGKEKSDPLRRRMSFVLILCIAGVSGIVARAAFIQIAPNGRLDSVAKKQFQSRVLMSPRRGSILDRNGEPIAVNTEIRSLAANPSKIHNPRTLARLLSRATDVPYSKLIERFRGKREFVWIKRHLTDSEFNRLQRWQIVDASGDPVTGLWIVKESDRVYPHAELAGHVIGGVNLDSQGTEGIELLAESKLKGKIVAVKAEKDALGRTTFMDAATASDVKDGDSVKLTIDASLQFSVEQELRETINRYSARSGSVIVMNAANGEILAMANEPSFNPNDRRSPIGNRRNRAITDGYEPGSTMKAILLAAALTKGMHLTDKLWGERGTFTVQGKRISEAEAHEKFEWLSLKKIIQVSSNIGAAKLALKTGADTYLNTLKAFGLGAKTDIDFPGEISGKIPPRKAWQPLSLANIGFGQGILVTPIQMVRAYAVFANGGWLVQPRLIMPDSESKKPETPKRIISQKVRDGVVEALMSVTEKDGTGGKAQVEGFKIAGKTGTAQVVDPATGRYSRSRFIASFIGFPVNVEPRIVVLAAVDNPHGVYYASEVAAPLFRSVMEAAVARLSLPPTEAERKLGERKDSGKDRSKKGILSDKLRVSLAKVSGPEVAAPIDAPLSWAGNSPEGAIMWKMPNLKGLTAREAIKSLQGKKFKMEIQGTGIVKVQLPEEGKAVAEGGSVRLTLSEP